MSSDDDVDWKKKYEDLRDSNHRTIAQIIGSAIGLALFALFLWLK